MTFQGVECLVCSLRDVTLLHKVTHSNEKNSKIYNMSTEMTNELLNPLASIPEIAAVIMSGH
jgi:uncharacterized protein with ATP-grasp and redox domains